MARSALGKHYGRGTTVADFFTRSAVAVAVTLAAGCAPASTEFVTATTSTTTAATTTAATVARSQWCLDRDSGQWPEYHSEPYDPGPLEAEKATIQQRLNLALEEELGTTVRMFGILQENRADDPALQAEIEASKQSTLRDIRAIHNDAVAELERRFVRAHREAREAHDTAERERAELAALEFRNEMMRYELECQ